jgi:hypothetical protein
MRVSVLMMAVALMAPGIVVHAQTTRDVYKVDFNIRDSGDAGAKSGRKYSMVLNSGIKGVFKVGNRVPTATGVANGSVMNTQFTYIDVGMNVDVTVNEQGAKFAFRSSLDISTAVQAAKDAPVQNPTISQIRLDIDTSVVPGKPSIVASFDDPVTGRKFDVEVTIVKM